MRSGVAWSLLLAAMLGGVGAPVAVFLEWSRMEAAPEAVSPALWAARAYLAYFDLCAAIAFVPCLMFCRRIHARLNPAPVSLFAGADRARRDSEFPSTVNL